MSSSNSTKIIVKNKYELEDIILDRIDSYEISLNEDYLDFNDIDVSNLKNLSDVFKYVNQNKTAIQINVEKWDTSNVRDMSFLFAYSNLRIKGIDNWNVKNVKDMTKMFYCAYIENIDELDFDKWEPISLLKEKQDNALTIHNKKVLPYWYGKSNEEINFFLAQKEKEKIIENIENIEKTKKNKIYKI